jgi:hypothetical protein
MTALLPPDLHLNLQLEQVGYGTITPRRPSIFVAWFQRPFKRPEIMTIGLRTPPHGAPRFAENARKMTAKNAAKAVASPQPSR